MRAPLLALHSSTRSSAVAASTRSGSQESVEGQCARGRQSQTNRCIITAAMPSERVQKRIDQFLDEAEEALGRNAWELAEQRAQALLSLDPDNGDAATYLEGAVRGLGRSDALTSVAPAAVRSPAPTPDLPTSFVEGRYEVRRFLGEGGKKKVYLAHDSRLDRDVAFALIKTEGLDEVGRERIAREAQAMGRLGAHPYIVSVVDFGEHEGQPYIVSELMGGGDVEALLEDAEGPLPTAHALEIAKGVARGLAFAHDKGVVHRDIKPGNVWLTEDGVAKIGDLGLAVSMDRSRLTQQGMMVGTVAYMPPEQALGGETTPQADLYSLGAMLYELVTGSPPFQADDPTAVISQHINTPPVAPSWHTEHCPPDLEELILRLLAKVPADRPASAADVLAALEHVDADVASASHSDPQTNPLERLAGGVFVGRERELERLRSGFDEAFAGRGSVVMLVGEPGIGKTRTVQELETYARLRGAQVFWGRANEAGGAPPYWPWQLVTRAYRAQNADEVRRREYGPYAAELQRIFPALRDLFPELAELPESESEEARFRLFDAMSGFLHGVSERTPFVVVLDDLHWADRPTLQLLAHLAREISRARIVIVGTYRDTDLDRRHPLSEALVEMNREDLFSRVGLRGLSENEVGDYVAHTAGIEPNRGLVRRIFEETEGNPFFLSEVVRLMTEEGTISATSVSDVALPEGVKQALGRRLDRLSEDANALLSTLAVVGRECEHALVGALSGHDADATLHLLEEALGARVLEELGAGQYRFTHALMQETLLGELSAARQVQLHGRIAQAIEGLHGESADELAAIALHYREAAVLNRELSGRALHYAWLAAQQAASRFAWGEAAAHYLFCLTELDAGAEAAEIDRGELLIALAVAQRLFGEFREAWRHFMRAIDLFRQRDDRLGVARAVLAASEVVAPAHRMAGLLDEAAAAADGKDDALWASLVARIGRNAVGPGLVAGLSLPENYPAMLERALQITRDRGLRDAEAEVLVARIWVAYSAYSFDSAVEDLNTRDGLGTRSSPLGFMEMWLNLALRKVDEGLESGRRALEAYTRIGARGEGDNQRAFLARIALNRARFDEVDAVADELRDSVTGWGPTTYALRLMLAGDLTEAAELLPPVERARAVLRSTLGLLLSQRAHVFAVQQDEAAARAELAGWLDAMEARGVVDDAAPPYFAFGLALVGMSGPPVALLGDREARWLYSALAEGPGATMQCASSVVFRGIDTLRGELALRVGEVDRAEHWFTHGVEFGTRWDLAPEVGCCLQGLADVAARRNDHALAMQHLDAAGDIFSKHGVKLYLDQVLAKKEILKA